jgi:hypothetical protein
MLLDPAAVTSAAGRVVGEPMNAIVFCTMAQANRNKPVAQSVTDAQLYPCVVPIGGDQQ